MSEDLRSKLAALTERGTLWHPENKGVRCFACGHRCFIPENKEGICKVRFNRCGELRVPWGYVSGLQVDPIEKKPFYHVSPGSHTLSFGMLGCDFHCAYCQNWLTSQTLRDSTAQGPSHPITIDALLNLAASYRALTLTSTYNEPLITSEWACAIFSQAHARGFKTAYVSNGNATAQVLEYLRPHVDFFKVDLKGFDDKHYRSLGGVLANIVESIELIHQMGFWLEVVTLLIPGFNDSEEELKRLAGFLARVSTDIPWHVTGYHPDYKMTSAPATGIEAMIRAAEIGISAGLHYVYLGNRPGQVGEWENTRCPSCRHTLIYRHGFNVQANTLHGGACPRCAEIIPGRWNL